MTLTHSAPTRVLVAMSGGVDSSLAAALLCEAGHDVVGVTMKTFCYSGTAAHAKSCCGLDGIQDARSVADKLGIPHYVFDVEEDFTRDVIDDFVSEYAVGRTPNPCVRCNSNTKFRDLMARGLALGCDRIASGHYVQIVHATGGAPALHRGSDPDKDQAYFLWGLPADLLPQLLFPVGALTKSEVRDRARALGLQTADKPESQEICFVPSGNYMDLLRTRLDDSHPALTTGLIVRRDGSVIGEHTGYAGYTVGQRRGLPGGSPEPLFVLEVRPDRREVVVGPRHELETDIVTVGGLNWLSPDPLRPGDRIGVQIRHRARAAQGVVLDSLDEDTLCVAFDEAQRAVTPGQSAALFAGTQLLGGGRIDRTSTAEEPRVEARASA